MSYGHFSWAFAVLFSTRPVACFQVSMTFSPQTLPIGFNGSVNMNLCFESCSATAAAETGTDGVIVQAIPHCQQRTGEKVESVCGTGTWKPLYQLRLIGVPFLLRWKSQKKVLVSSHPKGVFFPSWIFRVVFLKETQERQLFPTLSIVFMLCECLRNILSLSDLHLILFLPPSVFWHD